MKYNKYNNKKDSMKQLTDYLSLVNLDCQFWSLVINRLLLLDGNLLEKLEAPRSLYSSPGLCKLTQIFKEHSLVKIEFLFHNDPNVTSCHAKHNVYS